MSRKERLLVLRDEIHGDIVFDALGWEILNHPDFQRLRGIQQMGLADAVFPCASHSRFEHALGAYCLAQQALRKLVGNWTHPRFQWEGTCQGLQFLSERTRQCVASAVGTETEFEGWKRILGGAALLHDVGHGPWSHTFELLEVAQDYRQGVAELPPGPVRDYLSGKLGSPSWLHEDTTLLYLHRILRDTGYGDLLLPIALLVHKGLVQQGGSELGEALARSLTALGLQGGVDFHCLLRPLISGPFDADRMDYIQRDSRNSGVSLGGVEWRRILEKVIPCLASRDGKVTAVLICSVKNQHVLDDFLFSLFQMYTQVYLHPKVVVLEELIRLTLAETKTLLPLVTFETHRELSDAKFQELLSANPRLQPFLKRLPDALFEVVTFGEGEIPAEALEKEGYRQLAQRRRALAKDTENVFLYSAFGERAGTRQFHVIPWDEGSVLAKYFPSVAYVPNLWYRKKETH